MSCSRSASPHSSAGGCSSASRRRAARRSTPIVSISARTEIVIEDGRVVGVKGHEIGVKGHAKGNRDVVERADVVVGADGRRSLLAGAVNAERYNEKPPLLCGYYTYFSDLPIGPRFANYIRTRRGFAAAPTHDGLTLLAGGWPARLEQVQKLSSVATH